MHSLLRATVPFIESSPTCLVSALNIKRYQAKNLGKGRNSTVEYRRFDGIVSISGDCTSPPWAYCLPFKPIVLVNLEFCADVKYMIVLGMKRTILTFLRPPSQITNAHHNTLYSVKHYFTPFHELHRAKSHPSPE